MSEATRVIIPSFGAGELSPTLYGRVDLEKYRVGVALARNFIIDYRGGASNRPGFEYLGTSATLAPAFPRVVPFIVSTLNSYVVELGNNYATFWQNGVAVQSNLATPWVIADVANLKYTQSGSVLTVTHPSYPPQNITLSGTTFSVTAETYGPQQAPPTGLAANFTGGGGTNLAHGYVVTAVSADGKEESLATFPVEISAPQLGPNNEIKVTWTPPATAVSKYNVYGWGGQTGYRLDTPASAVFGFMSSTIGPSFVDNGSLTPDFTKLPPQFNDPFSPGQIIQATLLAGGNMLAAYEPLVITGGGGSGAAGYAICSKADPGGVGTAAIGAVITNPGKGYTSAPTIATATGATFTPTLSASSGTYPACVGYFQQRKGYAATNNLPETLTFSQPGNYSNFDTTPVSLDSDAITETIAGRQVNYIESLTSMNTGLVVMTTGGAFLVSGGGTSAAITPANFSALPQASSGANALPPLVVNYDILYCQNRGAVVRDLAFNFYVQSYTGTDRSVLASHLFRGFQLVDSTWAEEPFRLACYVRSDGKLLTMTYVPEQELFAWARHDTNGLFKSICSIPEGQENVVYAVIQRYLNGSWINTIERMASRSFTQLADAWFLDAAYKVPETFPSAAITLSAISGNGVTVTATGGTPFASGDVAAGKILWAGGGKATIASFISSTQITVNVDPDFPFPTVSSDSTTPMPFSSGQWAYDTPVTTATVSWLANTTVGIMVDGVPQPQQVASNTGVVNFVAGTKVLIGLPYSSQLKSLRLDTGDPTIQGKRKLANAVTLRTYATQGIQVGPDFDSLVDVEDFSVPFVPGKLDFSDSRDARELLFASWNKECQFAVQQLNPLPCTILALIPEFTVGDTAR